jgi:hypothetical protein
MGFKWSDAKRKSSRPDLTLDMAVYPPKCSTLGDLTQPEIT